LFEYYLYSHLCTAYLLYSTINAINRVELDGSQRTTVTTVGTSGVIALDFDIRYAIDLCMLVHGLDRAVVGLSGTYGEISAERVHFAPINV